MSILVIQKGESLLTIYEKDSDNEVSLEVEEFKEYTSICLNQNEIKEVISFLQQQLIDKT